MRRHGTRFNHIHLSAFWNLLGRTTSNVLQTFGYDGYANNNNTNARNNDWQIEYKDGLDLLVEQTKEIISAEFLVSWKSWRISLYVAKCGDWRFKRWRRAREGVG